MTRSMEEARGPEGQRGELLLKWETWCGEDVVLQLWREAAGFCRRKQIWGMKTLGGGEALEEL